MNEKTTQILDLVKGLTIMELNDLVKALEEEFGVSAAPVAVATPCCPAPVSAMTFFLPMRFAKRICPITLLILCAPVWFKSSRFKYIFMPYFSLSPFAKYNGVSLPTYCFR